MPRNMFAGACALVLIFGAAAVAQQPLRVHGMIASMDGPTLTLAQENGPDLAIKVADNAQIYGSEPAKVADIKVGDFIAVVGMPQPDGSEKASSVTIFAEAMRGIGEGSRPWDRPGTNMTNATVDSVVAGVDGRVIMLKYKDGEKKIITSPDTVMRVYVPADRSELTAGAKIAIPRAEKQPDGGLVTARVYVGRNGVVPQ